MAEISVIVPVYQVEQYIRQCVDSILAQTFTDFELILVDDGSTDRSGEICDAYARMDERVKVIHKENERAAIARNRGMDEAVGNYFMFVDSDDYLSPTMLECLYQNILKEEADLAACNYLYFFENEREKDFPTNIKSEILSGAEVFYIRKNERNYGYWTVVWNKLYRKETFEKIRFRSGKYFEDEFWVNDIYQMNLKIVTVSECLYYYRQHENSTMRTKSVVKNLDLIEAFHERIYLYLEKSEYADEAFKVLVYSLEYLEECKRLNMNQTEKEVFIQSEKRTKDILKQLRKGNLPIMKRLSLVFMEMNPCMVFRLGMKFRSLLEKFL